MSYADDTRRMDAKQIPMTTLVDKFGISGLRPNGVEMAGPCPKCGGRDRFSINLQKQLFNCRICGEGGDQIALVQFLLDCDFPAALEDLCGARAVEVDPREFERRRMAHEREAEKQRREADRYRQSAIRSAVRTWGRARPGHMGVVGKYLLARGIDASLLPEGVPVALRFVAKHPYCRKIGKELVTLHTGPCMIAGVLAPDGSLTAVHQTWVDPEPPHGKARIEALGEIWTSKLVRGSKQGGAIRLFTPPGADTLVMGEGIETTLTALLAGPLPGAAYWAGVDLGNMSGRMVREPGIKHSGVPDMTDDAAFVPPPWVRRLIFIQDGDSAPKMTRAKLESGLKRAMALRPGLRAQIVHAGAGVDLNDVLNRESGNDGDGDDG
ncbi:MAG: CHC2 zinc finger domain-containing protein [Pseudomonadota bacterium]